MVKDKVDALGPEIIFFCKDCNKIVKADKVGRKYVYRCQICKTKNVAFGTEKSIRSFYRVEEMEKKTEKEKAKKEKAEKEVKAKNPPKKEPSKK